MKKLLYFLLLLTSCTRYVYVTPKVVAGEGITVKYGIDTVTISCIRGLTPTPGTAFIIPVDTSFCGHRGPSTTTSMYCGGAPCNTCTCGVCGKSWKCY